jgi:hypothetical protein
MNTRAAVDFLFKKFLVESNDNVTHELFCCIFSFHVYFTLTRDRTSTLQQTSVIPRAPLTNKLE